MNQSFGVLPTGEQATLYTIKHGKLSASVTDYGATLVSLMVPDRNGNVADVVLGYDDVNGYANGTCFLGAVVGRNANRTGGAQFALNGKTVSLTPNEGPNNLHSGPDFWNKRFWKLVTQREDILIFSLHSPDQDQGYPGTANDTVTYQLQVPDTLRVSFNVRCDQDSVFNVTQHSYFNLAGQDHPEKAMDQILTLPSRVFTPADADSIPTGQVRLVENTPMDFRAPKPIGRDIDADYDALHLQGGYDHNYEVFTTPCAILQDPESGRSMSLTTDRPGLQFYAGNFLHEPGKGGVYYGKRSGVALEPQFYPDAMNHPQWLRPIIKAGKLYHSDIFYHFF